MSRDAKIVLLGMLSKIPVAGPAWLLVHYMEAFRRLGYEPYYVEAHARTPSMFMEHEADGGSANAAVFIERVLSRFGFGDRWAFHALHESGRVYGLSEGRLRRLYASADLIVNLHGGTVPLPEHAETGRLVYLETDPVELQVELRNGVQAAIDFVEPHVAFFSWGLNYGSPDCRVPLPERYPFRPSPPPVVLDFWAPDALPPRPMFTTIGNWEQRWRTVELDGETYHWSKHHEFVKFLELPRLAQAQFELALSSYGAEDRQLLAERGWRVIDALGFSTDLDAYRTYIRGSQGEFTVAKDQNVRLRSGWFSERSATYLAAGRPVITQETGFSNVVPTGEGLFGFSTMEDILAAVEAVRSDHERHARAAREIAHEYFDAEAVLRRLLADVGLPAVRRARSVEVPAASATRTGSASVPLSADLDLVPTSRWPTTLSDRTAREVLDRPAPTPPHGPRLLAPEVSVVVVTQDNLLFLRMCLETLLADPGLAGSEVVVVDNCSTDGTPAYLEHLSRDRRIHVVSNAVNAGFARGTNQGLAAARANTLLLLNDDAIAPPGSVPALARRLSDPEIGLLGPITNRSGDEAEIAVAYRTYGELVALARHRLAAPALRDTRTLTLFCAALRRDVYDRVGPLDHRFEVGMFEDDDYVLRVRGAGYRVVCAEDVFVHHFGQASIGKLAADGSYGELFDRNRRRFERKWGVEWTTHERRRDDAYEALVERLRTTAQAALPDGARVLVLSKGDEALVDLDGMRTTHFPAGADGVYAGHHPADSAEAIALLEAARRRGGEFLVFPDTSRWWLDHYGGLRRHLEDRYRRVAEDESCVIFSLADRPGAAQ